jgi:hypothetical protein
MIDIAAYIGALILVATAVVITILTLRAIQLVANQRAAWPYLAKLARLAAAVAADAEAPEEVRFAVNDIADHAFDKQFFRSILSMPTPAADREPFSVRVHREYGEHYGRIVDELIVAMTFIVLLSDRREGVCYRTVRRGIIRKRNAERIHELREEQIKPLRDKVNRNFAFQAA